MKRRSLRALAIAMMAAAVPASAWALLIWTLVASPLTTTANQSATFTLTATNQDLLLGELGCMEVDLPASFVIESVGTPKASNNGTWLSVQAGNSVIVWSLDGGGRLELFESVTFTITAHATAAGVFLWPNHAHRQQDCSNPGEIGVPLTVTVLPALLPTPTPAPTATPAPAASATPSPTPILPLPSISLPGLPSLPPSLVPTLPPIPGQTARPTPAPEPRESAAGTVVSGPGSADPGRGGSGSVGGPALTIARTPDSLGADADVGLELLGLLDADYVWFVPAASVALPGLLVILWVVLQAIGALAWIPAVRRMADEEGGRRRAGGARG